MKLPKVSIVIPTLNADTVLKLCLESISIQNYPKDKIEIVVGDGGSSDNTIAIAKKYNAKVFVKKNVKFFSKDADSSVTLPTYNFDSIISSLKNNVWIIDMHIQAQYKNESKESDINVKLNKKGEVIEFNGQKVIPR